MLKGYKYNLPDLSNCSICIIGLGYVGLPLANKNLKNFSPCHISKNL